jgi:hypothetical protein
MHTRAEDAKPASSSSCSNAHGSRGDSGADRALPSSLRVFHGHTAVGEPLIGADHASSTITCVDMLASLVRHAQEIQLQGASMHAHVVRCTCSKRGETDLFAGSEELHVPNVCFLAVHLDLRGGLDLVLQECPCTHAAISRAECAAQRCGATSYLFVYHAVFPATYGRTRPPWVAWVHTVSCSFVSHLGITLRVRDRRPLKGLGRSRRDQGAGDELPHPCACRH